MKVKLLLALAASAFPIAQAQAAEGDGGAMVTSPARPAIPAQLDEAQKAGYRAVFAAIHAGDWTGAQLQLDAMKPGPLHAIARAELYTAKGSPKVEPEALVALITQAPELPEASQLVRLATSRGAADLPPLPIEQKLTWIDGAPARVRAKSVKSDLIAADLATKMQPFIKDDLGSEAQALLETTEGLSPDATTEWQQKVAWMYFLAGDDGNARAMAAKAQDGGGDWANQARWVGALAAWRQSDWAAAETGFEGVAARAPDVEMRAAGLYWAARADMAVGRPDKIEARLKNAAQYGETFYGLLARQTLGIREAVPHTANAGIADDWKAIGNVPNVQVAAALSEIGESDLADDVIRHQAAIGDAGQYAALVDLAGSLDLPATQVWLSHNAPVGAKPTMAARFPAPNWTPDGGWRVDKALVYAHTLQESRFRDSVVSAAGAFGLMQIRPGAAADYAKARGLAAIDRAALTRPSTNMEVGQAYLEQLRDQPCTGGLLPKVIAAYNAGPVPVGAWNLNARDGGDPLLYIESIPYWETRGYVVSVMRNYWIYESETGKAKSASRAALAQGLWPRFPGMAGASAVRLTSRPGARKVASAD